VTSWSWAPVRSSDSALRLCLFLLALAALCSAGLVYLTLGNQAVIAMGWFPSDAPALGQQLGSPDPLTRPVGFGLDLLSNGAGSAASTGRLGIEVLLATLVGILIAAVIVLLRSQHSSTAVAIASRRTDLVVREIEEFEGGLAPRDLTAELNSLGAEIRRQAGNLSHEMRTPLAVIAGSAIAVRRALPEGTEKGRRSVDLIALSAERLVDLLDAHRDQTAELLDSYLGSQVVIDVGAFVQNFIAHARIANRISSSHPPQALYAWTQMGGLKEILHHLLVTADTDGQPNRIRLSLKPDGEWISIVVEYGSDDARPTAVVPGVEFVMRGQRVRLSLMGAKMRRTISDDGIVTVTLALPAGTPS
jgi:signal transduction histidine kinase